MTSFWLFVFGSAFGSFIKVIADRYDPDKFILKQSTLGGRSACPKCGHKLEPVELVPLLSFIFLRGRCRICRHKIGFSYPIVEIISGLIFVSVPYFLSHLPAIQLLSLSSLNYWLLAIGYILVFLTLLLISLIDIRLKIIPDEANIFLIIIGVALAFLIPSGITIANHSFTGAYALLFGFQNNVLVNHLIGFLFGIIFYGILIFVTRGRGMGMGDLKLSAALGAVFGWPDIIFITFFSFLVGSLASLPSLALGKRGLKSLLPFGPFIALSALTVFFFGEKILKIYFDLFRG